MLLWCLGIVHSSSVTQCKMQVCMYIIIHMCMRTASPRCKTTPPSNPSLPRKRHLKYTSSYHMWCVDFICLRSCCLCRFACVFVTRMFDFEGDCLEVVDYVTRMRVMPSGRRASRTCREFGETNNTRTKRVLRLSIQRMNRARPRTHGIDVAWLIQMR